MPRLDEARCETCRFFRAGYCYVNPPTVVGGESMRPHVEPEDFCLNHIEGRAPWNREIVEMEPA